MSVSAPSTGGLALEASGYKVKGLQKAELRWTGATAAVDIYRDGTLRFTDTENDGHEIDNIDARGGGSYRYHLCETGTAVCSGPVTVTF